MATQLKWSMKGEFFENCNCEVLCPCIMQGGTAMPDDGRCDVGIAYHIQSGNFNGVSLDGITFLAANHTPGPMADGNWTAGYYVDERASPEQREVMEQFLSGQVGGPAERWRLMTTDFRGIQYVPIDFKVEGRTRSVSIPGIVDFNVEGIVKPGQDDALLLMNAGHPANRDVYMAKTTRATYTDHGMIWDNTGKNGHYATFDWHSP